jgi:hypothetical protein
MPTIRCLWPHHECHEICCYQHHCHNHYSISITNLVSVTEACCDDKAESHKGPIDFRNINLALELVRGMYNLNMWKTAQSG